jgi:formate dehydrogenase major subunit
VADGGLSFRARFGVKAPEKYAKNDPVADNLLAVESWPEGSEIKDGYPEVTYAMLDKLGWTGDLTAQEMEAIKKVGGNNVATVNWKTDLSGGLQRVAIKHGIAPFGNAKARCVVWNFPDPVPLHREPLYTPRRDLVAQYPTFSDRKLHRVPVLYETIQKRAIANNVDKDFPIVLTSGRLVEYEGGGDETRSNPWLAELQQQMFVEINPADANNLGIKDGQMVWLEGPEKGKVKVAAMITERVGKGVAFMPFHFGGMFQGKDLRAKYPQGADPYVLGEASNTAQTYGYDAVTQMQETKTTLCKISRA